MNLSYPKPEYHIASCKTWTCPPPPRHVGSPIIAVAAAVAAVAGPAHHVMHGRGGGGEAFPAAAVAVAGAVATIPAEATPSSSRHAYEGRVTLVPTTGPSSTASFGGAALLSTSRCQERPGRRGGHGRGEVRGEGGATRSLRGQVRGGRRGCHEKLERGEVGGGA